MEYEHEHHSPSFRINFKPSSPSKWIRTKAQDLPEEIKDKFANFFSKIGGKARRRLNNTAEFRYDPVSYALNFDDEASGFDESPMMSFSDMLMCSPANMKFSADVSTQIAACSY